VKLSPGVHSVLVTPFAADESLDEPSLGTLIDYYVSAGVAGVLVLGVLGEADKLSDGERERVQGAALEHVAGRVQVTVGVSAPSTVLTAARAVSAERAGASAVMVAPPPGSVAGPVLRDHFRRVGERLSVPVVVQDLPEIGGVRMPVDFLGGLAGELPPGSLVKLEDPPTAAKTAALGAVAPALPVFGGLGGTALLHELDAGSCGTMTGFALPHMLVEIVAAHQAGERERARRAYEVALPLLLFEGQRAIGLGLRKESLRRRGAIKDATVRQPAPALDEPSLRALGELLEAAEADVGVRPPRSTPGPRSRPQPGTHAVK
jgi:4-hydroxy-tetrahydrodipicolinate synthase